MVLPSFTSNLYKIAHSANYSNENHQFSPEAGKRSACGARQLKAKRRNSQ
jgi:hypothetical protein